MIEWDDGLQDGKLDYREFVPMMVAFLNERQKVKVGGLCYGH